MKLVSPLQGLARGAGILLIVLASGTVGYKLIFSHDPAKWDEFQRRYYVELDSKPSAWQPIVKAAQQGNVTLLYSSRNMANNNAVALKAYLEKQLSTKATLR